MARFRKKPVEIEARQVDCLDHDGMVETIGWISDGGGTARAVGWECHVIAIDTLEGTMYADCGDWVIRGVKGEFYPCKPDIFASTYDRVA